MQEAIDEHNWIDRPNKVVCMQCDNIDPMKTDAAKWANSSLANQPLPDAGRK